VVAVEAYSDDDGDDNNNRGEDIGIDRTACGTVVLDVFI